MRRNRKPILNKERFIMLTASVFVLAALTMTGVYVRNMNQENLEKENRINLSDLKDNNPNSETAQGDDGGYETVGNKDGIYAEIPGVNREAQQKLQNQQKNNASGAVQKDAAGIDDKASGSGKNSSVETKEGVGKISNEVVVDDLDADPYFYEGTKVQGNEDSGLNDGAVVSGEGIAAGETSEAVSGTADGIIADTDGINVVNDAPVLNSYTPHLEQGERLQWPLAGEIVMNYSMDQVIWFETLGQYRYNPAIMVGAAVDTPIAAAADGLVTAVIKDDQLGNCIQVDLGDGYLMTYGQLKDIAVELGSVITPGQILGYVSEPTIFYTGEGCHLYLKVTKDGVAVNPLDLIQEQ